MRSNLYLVKLLNLMLCSRPDRFLPFIKLSFSQEGEDIILSRLFKNRKCGFYVDVGAHHPIRFSNTYYFYRLGWSGINIDACPGSMRLFNSLRPKDKNIEVAVGKEKTQLEYYIFDDPALNSFDRDLSYDRDKNTTYRIVDRRMVSVVPLHEILEMHLSFDKQIDFMSIDVEGLEMGVLLSNDWKQFSPNIVLIEFMAESLSEILISEIYRFMTSINYHLISNTPHTLIFQNKNIH